MMSAQVGSDFGTDNWNDYAKCYDALLLLTPYQELLSVVATALKPAAEDTILDAGCGTGNLLHTLSNTCRDATLYGIDSSRNMLAHAKAKCADSRVNFIEVDLNDELPFNDSSFNKIGSVNVLYALEDPKKTLMELRRILTHGGTLVIATPKKGFENGLILKQHCQSRKSDKYWANAHSSPEREETLLREAVHDERLVDMMLVVAAHNRRIAKTASFHFFSEEKLIELIESSGFTVNKTLPIYAEQAIFIEAQRGERP